MDNELYEEIKNYLAIGVIPKDVSSTRSNFFATARQYQINGRGFLIRNRKIVVKKNMQQKFFQEMHKHSGRSACWERIKQRYFFLFFFFNFFFHDNFNNVLHNRAQYVILTIKKCVC